MAFYNLITELTPPVLLRAARGLLRHFRTPEWEYVPAGWAHQVRGWNAPEINAQYERTWERFSTELEAGRIPCSFEALTDTFDPSFQTSVLVFAYGLSRAALDHVPIRILDWGGGAGHYALLARYLFPELAMSHTVVDLPVAAEYGRRRFPSVQFLTDESWQLERFDLVFCGTSFHYVQDWRKHLRHLILSSKRWLLLSSLPVTTKNSFVFVQRPFAYGYNTEYLGWCLEQKLVVLEAQALGARLVREFIIGHRPAIAGAPSTCEYRSFLFECIGVPDAGQVR